MATFSSLHNFNLSNSSSPSSTIIDSNMSTLLDETKNANFFSQFCQVLHEKTLDHSTNISPHYYTNDDDNDNNGTRVSSSIVTGHKYEVTQKINANKRKSKEPSFANCAQSKNKREVRRNKQKKMKDCEEMNKSNKEEEKEAPKGYVHVRARRGQATDRHSLAERVRREKISERMKLLQALVPGCDKVTGKALILDVIINYVQSLQNQVEFLSMKLASVNSMFYDLGMDLESFMVMLDENLSNLPQEYSPRAANNYPLIENFANSFLFEQDQSPNVFPQENRQVLWEVDEQRQRSINQSAGFNNNMFLFN